MGKRDYITKDFALYVVHYFNSMLTWSKEDILGEIDRTIKEAKPEDVARVVHGRWERMMGMMPPEYHGRHECSCCGVKALDWKFHEKLSNYCPNCGVKMDLEVN